MVDTTPPSPGRTVFYVRALTKATPLGRAVSILQTLDKHSQEQLKEEVEKQKATDERAQEMLAQARQQTKSTHREPDKEQVSSSLQMQRTRPYRDEQDRRKEKEIALDTAFLLTRRIGSNGRGNDRDGINSRDNTEQRRCFSEDHFSLHKPLERAAQNAALAFQQSIEGDLYRLGNTNEQERRLGMIYENPHRKQAEVGLPGSTISRSIPRYQDYMHSIAVKNGREVMDRKQDTHAAIATDRQAYQALSQEYTPGEAKLALSIASPNTADLSEAQKEQYLEMIQTPDFRPVKGTDMVRTWNGGRGGRSNDDAMSVLAGNFHLDRSAPTARDEKMFEAEFSDLTLRPNPGERIRVKQEYQRQLGEQIRLRGRQGIVPSKNECKEYEFSSDQLIAGRMYIAGHNRQNITAVIESSSSADKSAAEKRAYINEEIKPVFDNPFVQNNRRETQDFRIEEEVPSDINRTDCLERIVEAVEQGEWDKDRPEKTCIGYDSNNKPKDIDIEPIF